METLYVTDRGQWREWLSKHHGTEKVVWLLFYKKDTGKGSIPYDDAVEEAICFGWIDSIVKRIDDQTYARKFTPRTDPHRWSDLNKERARRMIEAGRMTPAGMGVLKADLEGPPARPGGTRPSGEPVLPPHLERLIRDNERAWAGFMKLTDAQRRLYIRWITDAKKDETRLRRVTEVIGLLEEGKPLGMK
jgi:uncharacterized protein YdeI (YjbR/CyaY-like superfamily)